MMEYISNLFIKNWQYKLGALLTAFVIWFYVASESNLTVAFSVPVQFDNFPSQMQIINKVANTVDIQLVGRRDIVNIINKRDVKVIINLKNAKEGKSSYRIAPQNIMSIPRGLEIRNVTPYQIEIELQRSTAGRGSK
jgi:YbbR domain-containing protein